MAAVLGGLVGMTAVVADEQFLPMLGYCDGITEAENLAGQQYGLARLCTVVSQHWTAPAEVINTLAKFVLHARQYHATQVVMKGSHLFPWQEKSLKNFQRLLPGLHLEIE